MEEDLRQKNVSALLYFFCARSISVKLYFHLVFQFLPQHNTSNTTNLRYIGPNVSRVFGVNSLPSYLLL